MKHYTTTPHSHAPLDTSGIRNQKKAIPFPTGGGCTLPMDLYYPESVSHPLPLILSVSGGGWYFTGLSSHHLGNSLSVAVSRGYAYASIGCTSSGEEKFPRQIFEVKAAIRFLRQNAEELRLDPERFGLWSNSSGGHLSLMAALTWKHPFFDAPQPEYPDISSRIQAVAANYPPTRLGISGPQFRELALSPDYDTEGPHCMETIFLGKDPSKDPELARFASPYYYITPEAPPLFLQHGTKDTVVPVTQSYEFADAYRRIAGPGRIQTNFPEGFVHSDPHMKSEDNCRQVLDFFDAHL